MDFLKIKLDNETREKISCCDPETIAQALYKMACDLDFSDYEENREKDISDLIECISQIKAISENPYNANFYRTFLFCLDRIASHN